MRATAVREEHMGQERTREAYERLFVRVEPHLRRALVAAYGPERGVEAAAEALAWAWEHWERLELVENPIAYLFRVGQSRSRPRRPLPAEAFRAAGPREPSRWVEPRLEEALASLTERQRVAVVLVHGFEWSHREVAELLGVTISTVETHLDRGLAKLHDVLEVAEHG